MTEFHQWFWKLSTREAGKHCFSAWWLSLRQWTLIEVFCEGNSFGLLVFVNLSFWVRAHDHRWTLECRWTSKSRLGTFRERTGLLRCIVIDVHDVPAHCPGVCWRPFSWGSSCPCWSAGQRWAVSTWPMPGWRPPCCRVSSTTPCCCSSTRPSSAPAKVRISELPLVLNESKDGD